MSQVNESKPTWAEDSSGPRSYSSGASSAAAGKYTAKEKVGTEQDWKFHAVEFSKGFAEMSVAFGKGVRDVVKQSIGREDSVIVKKLRGPCGRVCGKLRFLNEYLPEDRDPVHSWTAILGVALLAFTGLPGIRASILQEFGIRLVTYDLPGFGESDPHPSRNLESSALDMLHLSYSVNITGKFWVLGFSSGSMHAWAALRYIPDRIAGAILVAPMVNPYEPSMTKEERRRTWEKWTAKKKLIYMLAKKFPSLLPYFYRRSFLSGKHGQIDKWLSLSLGNKDKALIEHPLFEEFWQRDMEESVRQGNASPFVEEAVLQVSNWGFKFAELKVGKKSKGKGLLVWLKSMYRQEEEIMNGFLGPIHMWQGMDDKVVPPSMSDFVQRVLPDAMLHKLSHEGHFTHFYLCGECHRQMFSTVYGAPQGPLAPRVDHITTQGGAEDTGTANIEVVDETPLTESVSPTESTSSTMI